MLTFYLRDVDWPIACICALVESYQYHLVWISEASGYLNFITSLESKHKLKLDSQGWIGSLVAESKKMSNSFLCYDRSSFICLLGLGCKDKNRLWQSKVCVIDSRDCYGAYDELINLRLRHHESVDVSLGFTTTCCLRWLQAFWQLSKMRVYEWFTRGSKITSWE